MTLEELGYNPEWNEFLTDHGFDKTHLGRVVNEHKERYVVKTVGQEYLAEIIGQLRYSATERSDFPAIGDWVIISPYDDDKGLIHAVLPRKTVITRQAVGKSGEKQVIASNVDFALIMVAADRDFNLNRIERYLIICHTARVHPIILLNKIDLIDESTLSELLHQLTKRVADVPVFAISNERGDGIGNLRKFMEKGKTYCLLGSSGVGKSSLVNNLTGLSDKETNTISQSTQKGRHVTTYRELIVLENGSILIDNPGMREVGITDSPGGIEETFNVVQVLAENCRFKDCTHTGEVGCAVTQALEEGELDRSTLENYLKTEKERAHFEMSIAEKRKRDKEFGKMIKTFKKVKNYRKK